MTTRGNRILRLLDGLIRTTRAGKATWSDTDLEDTYTVTTKTGTVTISGAQTAGLVSGYGRSIRMLDREGNEVDSYSTSPVASLSRALSNTNLPSGAEQLLIDQKLQNLLELVRQTRMKADDVVDGIIRDLELGL